MQHEPRLLNDLISLISRDLSPKVLSVLEHLGASDLRWQSEVLKSICSKAAEIGAFLISDSVSEEASASKFRSLMKAFHFVATQVNSPILSLIFGESKRSLQSSNEEISRSPLAENGLCFDNGIEK